MCANVRYSKCEPPRKPHYLVLSLSASLSCFYLIILGVAVCQTSPAHVACMHVQYTPQERYLLLTEIRAVQATEARFCTTRAHQNGSHSKMYGTFFSADPPRLSLVNVWLDMWGLILKVLIGCSLRIPEIWSLLVGEAAASPASPGVQFARAHARTPGLHGHAGLSLTILRYATVISPMVYVWCIR